MARNILHRVATVLSSVRRTHSRAHNWNIHPKNPFIKVSQEVREAVEYQKPVVALETTIYTHGFPYPENVALASHLESLVRANGAIPATVGVLNGIARIGFEVEELIELTASAGKPDTKKISRRDLAFICGLVNLPVHRTRYHYR